MMDLVRSVGLVIVATSVACVAGPPEASRRDAGRPDAGTVGRDAGTVSRDAGVVGRDAGTVSRDAGTVSRDAGCIGEGTVSTSASLAPLAAALEARVAQNGGYGGGILRIAEGETVLLKTASGAAPDDTYHIASTSKAFTAAAVLLLVEDGAFTLDTPIGDLLSADTARDLLVIGGTDYTPQLTPRQLLDHTAGLPDYWTDPPYVRADVNAFLDAYNADPDRFFTPQELLEFARQLDPIDVPGAQWHYSDTGYVLAGLIIERHSGLSLRDFYRQRIYVPLGLEDTYLFPREPAVSCHPEAHRYEGSWDMTGRNHQSADWAGGGLVSSARDTARFIRGLMRGDLFRDQTTLDEMRRFHATGVADVGYGLGLYRLQLDGNRGVLWGHDGYGTAFMYYWPERDMTFSGTLNQTENDWWPLVQAAIE